MAQLYRIATQDRSSNTRITAIEAILSRTYGRPKQNITHDGDIEMSFVLRAPTVAANASEWEQAWGVPDTPPKLISEAASPTATPPNVDESLVDTKRDEIALKAMFYTARLEKAERAKS